MHARLRPFIPAVLLAFFATATSGAAQEQDSATNSAPTGQSPLPERPAREAADLPAADEALARGKAAFKKGRRDEARHEALEAWRVGGHPDALELLALAALQSGDAALATIAYRRLAALPDAGPGPSGRAERQLAALSSQTGAIAPTGPQGVAVSIDGRELGTLPVGEPLRAMPGNHMVGFAAGGRNASVKVRVKKGQTVEVPTPAVIGAAATPPVPQPPPVPPKGRLTVREGAERPAIVIVDGTEVGPSPWEGELAEGSHTLVLRDAETSTDPMTVQVSSIAPIQVVLELPQATGAVEVRVTPSGARLSVDGNDVPGGGGRFELPAGEHHFEASAEGYKREVRTLLVAPGSSTLLDLALQSVAPLVAPPSTAPPPPTDSDALAPAGVFGFAVLFGGPISGHAVVPCQSEADCTDHTPFTTGLDFAFGYDFRPVGVEFGLTATAGIGGRKRTYDGIEPVSDDLLVSDVRYPRDEDYSYYRFAGALTVGPRLTLGSGFLRFTTALRAGVTFKHFAVIREIVVGSKTDNLTMDDNYIAPTGTFELGALLGRGAGARFYVAAVLLADFPTENAGVAANPNNEVDTPAGGRRYDRRALTFTEDVPLTAGVTLGVRYGN
jgi:hypothetical protein